MVMLSEFNRGKEMTDGVVRFDLDALSESAAFFSKAAFVHYMQVCCIPVIFFWVEVSAGSPRNLFIFIG